MKFKRYLKYNYEIHFQRAMIAVIFLLVALGFISFSKPEMRNPLNIEKQEELRRERLRPVQYHQEHTKPEKENSTSYSMMWNRVCAETLGREGCQNERR